ncbi:MAG: GntR family transcriptional regulator [Desulfovibrio sp.]|nr:GntR family transcriptional regulator [Desulfovibrio sp.]MBI4958412.1 GntR family transcriptional regulator [Desulfovibrio sp.]
MPNRPSFRPLYQQAKETLLSRIAAGDWPPGTFLPSETALAKEYGVSQGTIRKALNELTSEGRVQRFQGKGTAIPTFDSDLHFYRFFLWTNLDGKPNFPSSQVVLVRKEKVKQKVATHLQLKTGDDVVRIERVRVLDGQAAINERIYLPSALYPDIEKRGMGTLPNTLYDYFQKRYGVTIARAMEFLTAVTANATDAKRLGVPEKAPLLAVRRLALDLHGRPVELRFSRCVTTRHGYVNELKLHSSRG